MQLSARLPTASRTSHSPLCICRTQQSQCVGPHCLHMHSCRAYQIHNTNTSQPHTSQPLTDQNMHSLTFRGQGRSQLQGLLLKPHWHHKDLTMASQGFSHNPRRGRLSRPSPTWPGCSAAAALKPNHAKLTRQSSAISCPLFRCHQASQINMPGST